MTKTRGHSIPGALLLLLPNDPNSWSNFTHLHCWFLSHYLWALITIFSCFYFVVYVLELFSWLFVLHLLRSSVLGRQSWGVLCLVQSFACIGCWTNVNGLCRCNLSQVCAHNGSFMWIYCCCQFLERRETTFGPSPIPILVPLAPWKESEPWLYFFLGRQPLTQPFLFFNTLLQKCPRFLPLQSLRLTEVKLVVSGKSEWKC